MGRSLVFRKLRTLVIVVIRVPTISTWSGRVLTALMAVEPFFTTLFAWIAYLLLRNFGGVIFVRKLLAFPVHMVLLAIFAWSLSLHAIFLLLVTLILVPSITFMGLVALLFTMVAVTLLNALRLRWLISFISLVFGHLDKDKYIYIYTTDSKV